MINAAAADFAVDGARLIKGALKSCMADLEAAVASLPPAEAGVRIYGVEPLRQMLASDGCIGAIAASVLGSRARAVRAILFNKREDRNWSLAWHQDRTICVKQKRDVPGFGPWTVKAGMNHVEPPSDLLARMVTLRAHLDDVPATNAPLLIAPGSHTLGRIPMRYVNEIVRRCGSRPCLAKTGDVWLYATSILHASEAASEPASRRVLQVDFAAEALPDGLEWLGV
jgi:phytanoyl-CoA dioxygenase PhyH